MILLYWIGIIVVMTVGLILTSISIRWMKRHNKNYKEVNINEWKKMNIINMKLKKEKAILEKEIIQLILQEDEEELEELIEIEE